MNGGFPPTHWPKAGGGRISVEGSFASNDVTLLTDAALRGLGITALPMLLVGVLLKRGELTRVLPELIHAESRVAIVFPEREFMPPHRDRCRADQRAPMAAAAGARSSGTPPDSEQLVTGDHATGPSSRIRLLVRPRDVGGGDPLERQAITHGLLDDSP
jgi:LysR substrate binding domain-containing protein